MPPKRLFLKFLFLNTTKNLLTHSEFHEHNLNWKSLHENGTSDDGGMWNPSVRFMPIASALIPDSALDHSLLECVRDPRGWILPFVRRPRRVTLISLAFGISSLPDTAAAAAAAISINNDDQRLAVHGSGMLWSRRRTRVWIGARSMN